MEERKVLLSVKDLDVKFRVRGRILTAIRGISLDIYENESIAIVGESGSGKSVFTKTFAGMLDSNGYIDRGSVIFNDPELSDTSVKLSGRAWSAIRRTAAKLDGSAKYEHGAEIYKQILELESERKRKATLSEEEDKRISDEIHDLEYQRTEANNLKQTFDPKKEKDKIREITAEVERLEKAIKEAQENREKLIKAHKQALDQDTEYNKRYQERMAELKADYAKACAEPVTDEQKARDLALAKEFYLSTGRYGTIKRNKCINALVKSTVKAMKLGVDLSEDGERDSLYPEGVLRCRILDEDETKLHGTCINDMAKIRDPGDWSQIRGKRIATVFQDPMTSLNPIITIGKQITSVILKHQDCSEIEARACALELMKKVGIPNAENRFDDYPFQYSGGMRQRIVIAIALSCRPKILICDEPTTALDVTIQAQILKLLKDLQKEYEYTIVFITHDLGVVANIADRVAVIYAGQIVEVGTVEEVFYDPRHPYTWALLSSLPQLTQKDTELFSIAGTPPSLYNKITGDAFAPRNPHCMKIDTLLEPPMFKVTDTHYAKTWLLDPRAPKIEKPEIIRNTHEKLIQAFNI